MLEMGCEDVFFDVHAEVFYTLTLNGATVVDQDFGDAVPMKTGDRLTIGRIRERTLAQDQPIEIRLTVWDDDRGPTQPMRADGIALFDETPAKPSPFESFYRTSNIKGCDVAFTYSIRRLS